MIFRRLDGRAKDPRTIPPADAISWRRLSSIVTQDLLTTRGRNRFHTRNRSGRRRSPRTHPKRGLQVPEWDVSQIKRPAGNGRVKFPGDGGSVDAVGAAADADDLGRSVAD